MINENGITYLSRKEIYEKYHISHITLYVWEKTGKIKTLTKIENGRAKYYYPQEDIENQLRLRGKLPMNKEVK